MLLLLFI